MRRGCDFFEEPHCLAWRMPVRGRVKCRIVATLFAITHNVIHQGNVRAAVSGAQGNVSAAVAGVMN